MISLLFFFSFIFSFRWTKTHETIFTRIQQQRELWFFLVRFFFHIHLIIFLSQSRPINLSTYFSHDLPINPSKSSLSIYLLVTVFIFTHLHVYIHIPLSVLCLLHCRTAIILPPEINTDDDIVPVYPPQHPSQLYLSNNPPTVSHGRAQDYDPYYPTAHSIPSQHHYMTGTGDTGRYQPQTPVTMAESSSPHLLQPSYFQGEAKMRLVASF